MARLDPGPSIKGVNRFKVLRRNAVSQEGRALIFTTQRKSGRKGRVKAATKRPKTSWHQAAEMGIQCGSAMDRAKLVDALRNH